MILETATAMTIGILFTVVLASLAFVSVGLFHYKHRAEKKALYLKGAIRAKEELWKTYKKLLYKYETIVAITQEND